MDEFDVLREYLQDKHGGTGVTHHSEPSAFTAHLRIGKSGCCGKVP